MELGQLFIIGFDGSEIDHDHRVVEDIVQHGLGGVILFARNVDGTRQNIRSPEQLKKLTSDLQEYAEIPLLIAVDQEGGKVCRLREEDGFPPTVSAGRLGRDDDPGMSAYHSAQLAGALKECGVNFNLAPVVDLDRNPHNPVIGRFERSFGVDPIKVAAHAATFIDEHHKRNILCCLKHFPGHGSSSHDSHLGFTDVTDSWHEKELLPYRRLIEQGLVDAVMSAHVVNRRLDNSGLPATLSRKMLEGVLREKIGFSGPIISDDLQMRAITDKWPLEEAVVAALHAGVDLLVIGNNIKRDPGAFYAAQKSVERAITKGEVSKERIRESLSRISRLKQRLINGIV